MDVSESRITQFLLCFLLISAKKKIVFQNGKELVTPKEN